MKIAYEYRRAHRNLLDLVQEGNIGLMQAVQKYDPYRGVKLSSYAAWWIRAYILKFILNNWRLVKIGTTQAQRKLFFNLRKEREKLEQLGFELEAQAPGREARRPREGGHRDGAPARRVRGVARRARCAPTSRGTARRVTSCAPRRRCARTFRSRAASSARILKEKLHAFGETLRDRDLEIFRDRLLNDEPATLVQIAERFGVTRERVRQIEERLKKRLRQYLEAELGDAVQIDDVLE